jgi:hypothetical protein
MSSEPSPVEVSGGRGVVVGDYNSVFQVFAQAPPSIRSYMRTEQFRPLIEERTKGFVGREFVFDGIARVLGGGELPSGYVMVLGEPGIGKTAIAASLVVRGGHVHHFNIAPENIRTPRHFLENVCAQLISRYDLDHATMPPGAGEDSGFLLQLLNEAAERARAAGTLPVVVVVDALDEAEESAASTSANRLFLPRTLPDGVFFVVTSREEADNRLDVDRAAEIWIRDDDPANRADVAHYVEAFIESRPQAMKTRMQEWGVSHAEFVEDVIGVSEGNFMYLVHVLPEIAGGRLSRATVGGIEGLPRGLRGYYRRHWRDMKDLDPDRFAGMQRPVLCFLAISREPVGLEQLTDWTGLEPGDVGSVLDQWREFLNEHSEARPPRYRIYHRSFAEFLDEQENLRWYHEQIAQRALDKIPGLLEPRS